MAAQTATRRPLGALGRISVVVAMHAALLLVLARSFGITPPSLFEGSEHVQIDETTPPDDVLPPPPNPTYAPTDYELVAPDVPIPLDGPADAGETISTPPDRPGGEVGRGSALAMPVIQGVRADPRRPLTQPPYPATEIRQGNQGFVDVEVYVLPDGRVGDARIVKSSGFERLDQSTLDEARRRWRLLPATRDGAPFAQWHRLRVKFELRN